jgi:multiple sugar transport system substrate-binding protein
MSRTVLNQKLSNRARLTAIPAALGLAASHRFLGNALAQDQTTVRLTGWSASPEENTLFSQILQQLQDSDPTIKIDYQVISAEYNTKLQTDIAAGSAADVFYVDSLPAPDYMANAALLQLDDYMTAAGVKSTDFYPGLIGAFQLDEKTYGLPKDWSSLAMVYDTQALTDAGVATPPTSWEELTNAGKALLDKVGSPRIMINTDMARYLAFHYAAGASVLNEYRTQITINSPEAEQALTFYYGMYKDGIATTPADAGADWPGDGFAKDFADIVFEGNWVFPFLQTSAPDLKFGISEMPAGPGGKATLAFTVSFSIYGKTKEADASWKVVNYLTGAKGMGDWTNLGLAMPTRPALADAWLAKFPEREAYLKSGDYANPWQLGVGGQAFYTDANAELEALFAGTKDVKTTLTNMEKAAKNRLQLGPATPIAQ